MILHLSLPLFKLDWCYLTMSIDSVFFSRLGYHHHRLLPSTQSFPIMCHMTRKIYTVCAHSKEEGPFECKAQKDRIDWYQDTGFCGRLWVSLSRCWPPVKLTELIYGFCEDCLNFYRDKGHETRTVSAILKYWASRGYTESVSAGSISDDICKPPVAEDLRRPRCEYVAFAKVLPRGFSEPLGMWLQRLESVRESTLQWAEITSSTQTRQEALPQAAVHFQPGLWTPQQGGEQRQIRQDSTYTGLADSHFQALPRKPLPTRCLTPVQNRYGSENDYGYDNNNRSRPEGSKQQMTDAEPYLPTLHHSQRSESMSRLTRVQRESREQFIHLREFSSDEAFSEIGLDNPRRQQLEIPAYKLGGVSGRNNTRHPFSFEDLVGDTIKTPEVSAADFQACLTRGGVKECSESNMTSRFIVSDVDVSDGASRVSVTGADPDEVAESSVDSWGRLGWELAHERR